MVLAHVQGTIRAKSPAHPAVQTFATNDAGDYTVELAAGEYEVCLQREGSSTRSCESLTMQTVGDTWIVTQLHDGVPDVSNIGNHAY